MALDARLMTADRRDLGWKADHHSQRIIGFREFKTGNICMAGNC